MGTNKASYRDNYSYRYSCVLCCNSSFESLPQRPPYAERPVDVGAISQPPPGALPSAGLAALQRKRKVRADNWRSE